MLSKSQAKAFFIWGTVLCGGAFIGLTIDTFQRIPKLTNSSQLTESVVRGKHLFEKNNCMGCHTILGEGAYYAPELTKVYERRGEAFIAAMLKDPQSMYPGQRKMVQYKFNDQDIRDLTAFFQWIGQMDLQGFPPKPSTGQAIAAQSATGRVVPVGHVSENRPPIFGQMCVACHALQGQGGTTGPALDGVGSRRDADYIKRWLTDPLAIKADSKMPKLPLTQDQIAELTRFLSGLKENQ